MKLSITIEYNNGGQDTFVTCPPDVVKWERATKKSIRTFKDEWAFEDICLLAYNVYKRENAGTPTLSFDQWMDDVANVSTGEENPKATSPAQ